MPKILSPSDKFQMRGIGDLRHPGSCMSCGAGTCQEGYVDLGTYFDYEGQMYLCYFCLQEAAEVLGCLTIAESKLLIAQNEDFAQQNKELTEALDNANKRLAAFDLALKPVIFNGSSHILRSEDSESVPADSGGSVTELNPKRAAGKSAVKKSVAVKGTDDINGDEPSDGFDL